MNEITKRLTSLYDAKNADFLSKLLPTTNRKKILGVKIPVLKGLAKEYYGAEEGLAFIADLPHEYLEENALHAFIICREKDFDKALRETEEFLPYIDNWLVCDSFKPSVFKKNAAKLTLSIDKWIASEKPYTVRFAISMLMTYFLDENYSPDVLKKVAGVKSDFYYVNMMVAWFFATALYKRYDDAIKYFESPTLTTFCHNKAIQKARESLRIPENRKNYLNGLKRKG